MSLLFSKPVTKQEVLKTKICCQLLLGRNCSLSCIIIQNTTILLPFYSKLKVKSHSITQVT